MIRNSLLLLSLLVAIWGLQQSLHQFELFNSAQLALITKLMGSVTFFGFGGSILFLVSSKPHALRIKGVRGIILEASDSNERWLPSIVSQQARALRIAMPQLAVYDSEKLLSFSTGRSKDKACIVISSGVLTRMTKQEITAVVGHEMSHIANGDMATQALLQGFYSTLLVHVIQQLERLVIFLADQKAKFSKPFLGSLLWDLLVSSRVKQGVLDPEEDAYSTYECVSICMNVMMGFIPLLVVCWFSRWREFRADAQSAAMVGNQQMIAVLERLKTDTVEDGLDDARILPFGICALRKNRWTQFRHPSIEDRIAKLKQGNQFVN